MGIVTQLEVASLSVTVEWFEQEETKGKEISLAQIFELNPDLQKKEVDTPPAPVVNQKPQKTNGRPMSRKSELPVRQNRRTMVPRFHSKENQHHSSSPPNNEPIPGYKSKTRVNDEPPIQQPVSAASKVMTTRSKKSNVVDEVEKLRKNREERRAAQTVERERRNQHYDPSNANYDFMVMITEYRESLDINPLTTCDDVYDHRICVCVLKRPLNKKENNRKELDVCTIPTRNKIMISEPKAKVDMTKFIETHPFRFDYTFNESCPNETVYWYTAKPLVEQIFNGGMATCFAYGRTGSGKTHVSTSKERAHGVF